tara:strand:+ start:1920 stop:2189 length:270 start_codon:yes stop_codon:yes gene_type:complete
MKSLIWTIAFIAATGLSAESIEPGPEAGLTRENARQDAQGVKHVVDDNRVVVITEAEFVPFSQYLGLPDVNNLPPTSAGNPKPAQHRMP